MSREDYQPPLAPPPPNPPPPPEKPPPELENPPLLEEPKPPKPPELFELLLLFFGSLSKSTFLLVIKLKINTTANTIIEIIRYWLVNDWAITNEKNPKNDENNEAFVVLYINWLLNLLEIPWINIEKNITPKYPKDINSLDFASNSSSTIFAVYSPFIASIISLIAFRIPSSYCDALKLGLIV